MLLATVRPPLKFPVLVEAVAPLKLQPQKIALPAIDEHHSAAGNVEDSSQRIPGTVIPGAVPAEVGARDDVVPVHGIQRRGELQTVFQRATLDADLEVRDFLFVE